MHTQLTDSQLYRLAQEYGLKAKQWLRKFEGLLPEIYRRKLYKRRGFASIHEFAGKLAGMSHEKVDKILRLSKHLEDKPALKALLESGAVGYSKIETVAYIATPETENIWAEKVTTLPRIALELCVQASRKNYREEVTPGGNSQPEFSMISIKISSKLEYELRLLKQKLEKEQGETLGFAEVLQELLKAYKSANRKMEPQRIIQLCPKCIKEEANEVAEWTIPARLIPKEIQHLVIARQKEKCAFPNCDQPPQIFHHTRRFALNQNHDPDYIVHLCTAHERLAHSGLIQNEECDATAWRIQEQPDFTTRKFKIDEKVNAYRREPNLAKI